MSFGRNPFGQGATAVSAKVGAVAATERRLGRMLSLIRLGTAAFTLLPFTLHARLGHPFLAGVAAALSIGFALVLTRLCWHADRILDAPVAWTDLAVTLLVAVIGTNSASGTLRPQVMTELVPFCLAGAATVGFVLGASVRGAVATLALATSWVAVAPQPWTLKLGSDALGFLLWYVVATSIATEWRRLARQTDLAEREWTDVLLRVAEDEKEELATEYREELQTSLHDQMLPILEHLANGGDVNSSVRHEAGLVAGGARAMLARRHGDRQALTSLALGIRDAVMAVQRLGLTVTSSMAIVDDPPPEIVAAAVSATREALNNVLKHAQTLDGAKLYVEATQKDLRICVRDRGVGLGSRLAPTTGGLVRSTAAFLRLGGECTLLPGVGGGTQVTLRWLAADPGEKGSLRVLFDQPRVPDSRTNGEELGVSTDNATVR